MPWLYLRIQLWWPGWFGLSTAREAPPPPTESARSPAGRFGKGVEAGRSGKAGKGGRSEKGVEAGRSGKAGNLSCLRWQV